MVKKRKWESKPQQIEVDEEQIMAEEDPEEFEEEEVIEYEEVEEEEEEVEYEEEEEEEEEEGNEEVLEYEEVEEGNEEEPEKKEEKEGNKEEPDGEEEVAGNDEDDEEPVQSLLSAFTKEALITLLSEAAERHPDVAASVRASAEVDPSHRKIFVHGLNGTTTSEMLREEFLNHGEIEECHVVTDKATGRSKGYGFILFKTGRAARQALREPQKVINNGVTWCQLASVGPVAAPLQQKQKVQGQQQSECTERKIYVSNVGAELDPEKLKAFFSQYGEIEEGPLGLDNETGKPKGFCLFVYKTVESAKLALVQPHKQFEGVTLRCQQAIDGPKSHKSVTKNQHLVDNVAGPTVMPVSVQAPPPPLWQHPQQLLNVDPAALGQAVTALMAAQGAGWNLLGALGAVGAGTGPVHNPADWFSGQVRNPADWQGGYGDGGFGAGGGKGMGSSGIGGYGDQGGYPIKQKRRRGAGR